MKALDRLLHYALVVILLVMAVIAGANVFARYALNTSLSWGEEVVQILLVWMTYLGAAYAMKSQEHFAFDLLVRALPPRAGKIASACSGLLVIAMTVYLIYLSAIVTVRIRFWSMPATELSRAWVYAACPIGSTLLLVYAVRNWLDCIREPIPSNRTDDVQGDPSP